MKSKPDKLPRHIAFIMDGNGRWAQKHLLPRNLGHSEGVKTMKKILRELYDMGVSCVSMFAFSTENANRPKDEIDGLVKLLRKNIGEIASEFISKGIRINVMGDLSYFPEDLASHLIEICTESKNLTKGILNLGLNYGSRAEIVRAVNLAVERRIKVTEQSFGTLLYTDGLPEPDLIIRTSGERRLSNFMMYQSAYAELYFTDVLWPDFDKKELLRILEDYAERDRRFGKV